MVDVDRRMQIGHNQAHLAALKRLCARAKNNPRSLRKGLLSFTALATKATERLKKCGVLLEEGLRDEEFARIEAEFGFSFPPDLRAVLAQALPVGAGFPDWRSGGSQQIRMRLNIPLAGLSYQVARGKFWWKQWGQRPCDTETAAKIARQALRKVPLLVPLYSHFYVPSSPELAGNPVLFVHQNEVFCYAYDLVDFFDRGNFGHCDQELELGVRKAAVVVPSLRRDKSLNLERNVDELYCKERADNLSRKHNNIGREDWRRNLDCLAKCPDANSDWWRRRSIDERQRRKSCHSIMGSNDHSPKITEKLLVSGFSRAKRSNSQAGLSRTPRWIEFWSELVEKRERSCFGSPEKLFSSSTVDFDLAQSGEMAEDSEKKMPTWLTSYLEGLAAVLRQGGWKEEDITDIIEASSSSSASSGSVVFDRQAVEEGMVLKVGSMSESLRRAGWSSQDVSEIFSFEFHLGEPLRRQPKKLAPEFVERIGKLVALN